MATKEDLILQRIDDLKDSTEQRLDSIDINLAEHMRRTDVLESLHRDNLTRIQSLEEPKKARKYLVNTLLKLGALLGVVMTGLKLLEMMNG